ncbi:MAG: hypothetical protein K0U38_08515 [Epsilonproteobacteria bacterium]|nr:hypothetical protein [Campylobacterota bacterium]
MKKNNTKHLALSLVTILMLTACGGSSSTTPESTSTPVATATPTPISTPTPPVDEGNISKPKVTNVPESTTDDSVLVEIQGEAGTTVWVNGEEVGTMGIDGKIEIILDTSGDKGSKIFSVVLKNAMGQSSEALVILVEKEELPSASTSSSGGGAVYNPPAVAVVRKGTLIDSTVVGVTYDCGTKTGKTDENGTFECSAFPVVFTVGNIEIGRISAMTSDAKVFVQDLAGVARDNFSDPKVLKIAKFLQGLDDDGSYDESIKIDDGVIALGDAKKLSDMNLTEVTKLLTDNGFTPISDDDVIAHLIDNAHDDVNKTVATDGYAVFVDKEDLNISDGVNVTDSLILPTIGGKGSNYTYTSTDEALLSSTGVPTRQSYTDGNKSVTIVATITKGTVSDTKEFPLNVVALPISDLESVTLAEADLSITGTLSAIDGDVVLATNGLHGVNITWVSDNSAISTNGVVTRPSFTLGNQIVQLTSTLTKGSESITKVFSLTVLKLAITDAEIVANVKGTLDLGDTSSLTTNLTLPTLIDGVTITWSSSGDAISDSGVINPDNHAGIDKTATLTATLTKGAVSETKTFDVTVPKLPMTDDEKVALDKAPLELGDTTNITEDLTLPTTGTVQASQITWSSSDTNFLSDAGVVTRPSYAIGDKNVTLTATITNGSASDTKVFTITVKHLDMTGDEMIADAQSRLDFDDIKGTNSGMNNIVANLSLPSNLIVDNGSNVLIKWESTPSSLIDSDGTIHSPSFAEGNATVVLRATIGVPSSADPSEFDGAFATVDKEFDLVVVALDMTDAEAVALAKGALSLGDTSSITANMVLPSTIQDNGVQISWESNNSSVVSNTGVVTRPSFVTGDVSVTLIATLTLNGVSDTKEFVVTVVKEDAITEDLANLAVGVDLKSVLVVKGAYTLELYTNASAPTATSQESLAVYGNLRGVEGVVLLEANSAYAIGTQFQVLVKDQDNNVLAKSAVITSVEGETGVNFGTINIRD